MRGGGTQIEAREEQERMTADQIIEERREREAEERGKRIRESKYNIRYKSIAKEKLPKYLEGEDEVERQKNTGKIQMWKRDQSKGILEGRGWKKMQIMWKEWRRPETCNRRMWNNGRTKGHRKSAKWDRRRFNRAESNNKEEKGKRQEGCTARRLKLKVAIVFSH